jgi:hypothetical protein
MLGIRLQLIATLVLSLLIKPTLISIIANQDLLRSLVLKLAISRRISKEAAELQAVGTK